MIYTDELLRQMIAEYENGAEETELLARYGMRKDKWSKIKHGTVRKLSGIEYPVTRKAEKELREEVAGWLNSGESANRIAQELGMPYSKVRRIAAELKAEGLTIERRKRSLTFDDSLEMAQKEWDKWRYAYEEYKAEWNANQRMMENVYRARGIPSQRMPFPLGWEDLQCRHSEYTNFKDAKQIVAREVELWLQTLLSD